jgi:hypothetical protein
MAPTETTETRGAPSTRHEVTVWLDQPLWGRDHATGELVQSNRHRVEAAYVLQDAVSTQVADEDGEVLLAFPTPAVARLTWAEIATQAPGKAAPTPPEAPTPMPAREQTPPEAPEEREEDVGSKAWRAAVAKKCPRAYEAWTADEDERLRQGRAQGLTAKALAARHQRREGAILARMAKLAIR